MIENAAWSGFSGRKWKEDCDVRDFIQNNYLPYDGDESFLKGPSDATEKLWGELQKLQKEERAKGGVLDMETSVVSSLTSYGPGYLDKDLEKVVGLQTDKPLKRAFMPFRALIWRAISSRRRMTSSVMVPSPQLALSSSFQAISWSMP